MNNHFKPIDPPQPSPIEWLKDTLAEIERHKDRICDALEHGDHTHSFDDVATAILTGKLRLHSLPNSVIVTEVINYPQGRYLHGFLAAGDLDEITEEVRKLESTATQLGCVGVSIAGRPGWKRVFNKLGWKPSVVVMSKNLKDNSNV